MDEQREELYVQLIRSAARRLTGHERRSFVAEVTQTLCADNPRQSERMFGWGRETVALGIRERDAGIRCQESFCQRGRKRTEDKHPELLHHIRELVEPHTQADPQLQNAFAYTRLTAKALRAALIEQKGYRSEDLPSDRTLQQILNRLGYRLRRIQKAKPLKKIPETDAIFANVQKVHKEAANDPETLEISVDTKAKVPFGEYSRGGKTRSDSDGQVPAAWDHDPPAPKKGVPFGILNVVTGALMILFGTSYETGDFWVDCLDYWWDKTKDQCGRVKRLVIRLDNGPVNAGDRKLFLKRLVAFAQRTQLEIHLVYYPPYHSKYNPIERVWGILEEHWNGTLLTDLHVAMKWAKSVTWNGQHPGEVMHLDRVYQKGIRVSKQEMLEVNAHIQRSETLPKWDVTITPHLAKCG
jgi:hypothetical protein